MSRITFFSLFATLIFTGAIGQAGDQTTKAKPTPFFCPVAGIPRTLARCCPNDYCSLKPSNKHLLVFPSGAKLQFCCDQCLQMYKSPVDLAYGAKTYLWPVTAHHQFVATGQAKQVKCPVTGDKMDPAITLEVVGIKVAFANEQARKKVADADAWTRQTLVFDYDAFGRGFVMQKR